MSLSLGPQQQDGGEAERCPGARPRGSGFAGNGGRASHCSRWVTGAVSQACLCLRKTGSLLRRPHLCAQCNPASLKSRGWDGGWLAQRSAPPPSTAPAPRSPWRLMGLLTCPVRQPSAHLRLHTSPPWKPTPAGTVSLSPAHQDGPGSGGAGVHLWTPGRPQPPAAVRRGREHSDALAPCQPVTKTLPVGSGQQKRVNSPPTDANLTTQLMVPKGGTGQGRMGPPCSISAIPRESATSSRLKKKKWPRGNVLRCNRGGGRGMAGSRVGFTPQAATARRSRRDIVTPRHPKTRGAAARARGRSRRANNQNG